MAIRADFHLHSSFSGDSKAPMGEMVERGIALGLGQMCFTEHMDFDFPVSEGIPKGFFEVNTDAYLYELLRCRAVYGDRIKLCCGAGAAGVSGRGAGGICEFFSF